PLPVPLESPLGLRARLPPGARRPPSRGDRPGRPGKRMSPKGEAYGTIAMDRRGGSRGQEVARDPSLFKPGRHARPGPRRADEARLRAVSRALRPGAPREAGRLGSPGAPGDRTPGSRPARRGPRRRRPAGRSDADLGA